MNSKFKLIALFASVALTATLCACAPEEHNNPDSVNPPSVIQPAQIDSQLAKKAEEIIKNVPAGLTAIPNNATKINGKITISTAGSYYVDSEIAGKKITVDCEGVTLYLANAKLSNEKKVIESNYPLTITLIGENTVSNSNELGSNAIDCTQDLIINGNGSLKINSTKNGIKANSVSIVGVNLEVTSENDGLHAEVEAYDSAASAPSPSYNDGGYVFLNDASVKINSNADGIQADTFVYISDSTVNIKAGGGAPDVLTEDTVLAASGKGIKAGPIDWGLNKTNLEWDNQLVNIKDSTVEINSNDDAVHSDGEVNIENSKLTVATGATVIKADKTINLLDEVIETVKYAEKFKAETVNTLSSLTDD